MAALTVPLCAVIWRAEGLVALRPSDWQALWFTLWQAALSALISVTLAIPVARALARRRFPGRGPLVLLLGAPFILPVIVAVLGLVALFGRSGLINTGLDTLGLPTLSIYGAHGVILAHVFFNMPLATRLILQAWADIPSERFRTAASLGFTASDLQRHLEWPMLRRVLPGIALVIFLICTTSFAIALALGGGPRSTTIELAIYQAFRFDFDLGRAALLALVQMALGIAATLLALRAGLAQGFGPGLDRAAPSDLWPGRWLMTQDTLALCLATTFLLAPLALVLSSGAMALFELPSSVWIAALRSLIMALTAAILTGAIALIFARAIATSRLPLAYETIALLAISASPLVLGTGAYLLLLPHTNPIAWALPLTVAVNVLLSLPFATRALVPAMRTLTQDYDRLSASLNITGIAWLRIVALPRLRAPLGFAAGLTAALSAGDLGVITLFADPDQATLPLQLYQLMGAYRMDQAKGAALILIALSLALFWLFEKGGRHGADA